MKKLLILMILLPLAAFGQTRPHWLQLQGRPLAYVSDYGAVGDGVTDDTDAIKAAVADLPSSGGIFYFGNGKTYLISSTINFDQDNIIVDGGGSFITSAGSLGSSLFNRPLILFSKINSAAKQTALGVDWSGDLQSNVVLKNMRAGGVFTGNPTTTAIDDSGNFAGPGSAICFMKTKNFLVDNVHITSVPAHGFDIIGCIGNNTIRNSSISIVRNHGIASSRSAPNFADRGVLTVDNVLMENIQKYAADFHQFNAGAQETGLVIANSKLLNIGMVTKNQAALDGGVSTFLRVENNYIRQSTVFAEQASPPYSLIIFDRAWNTKIIEGNIFFNVRSYVGLHEPRESGVIRYRGNQVTFGTPTASEEQGLLFTGALASITPQLLVEISGNYIRGGVFLAKPIASTEHFIVGNNTWKTDRNSGILGSTGPVGNFRFTNNTIIKDIDNAGNLFGFPNGSVGNQQSTTIQNNTFRIKDNTQTFGNFNSLPEDSISRLDGNTFITDKGGSVGELFGSIASLTLEVNNVVTSYTP